MRRLAVLAALALPLALAACTPDPPPPPASADTMGAVAPTAAQLALSDTTITRDDQTLRLSLTVPRAMGPGAEAVNAAYDTTVARIVDAATADAREMAGANAALPEPPPGGAQSTLDGRTEAPTVTARVFSARTTYSRFSAGAAHPNTAAFVVNIDRQTGRPLALATLFADGAAFLDTLSARTRADVRAQMIEKSGGTEIPEEMLRDGTAPAAASFALFTLAADGLHLYFPQYAVAPYVFGDFETVVPWSALRPMLREDGPASGL